MSRASSSLSLLPSFTATLLLLGVTGCSLESAHRPCGPGYLGNALVPQGFAGADFRPACQRHDDCYSCCPSRQACDDQFYQDMLAACECSQAPCLCRLRAWQWYVQVRLFGGHGYEQAQHAANGCP